MIGMHHRHPFSKIERNLFHTQRGVDSPHFWCLSEVRKTGNNRNKTKTREIIIITQWMQETTDNGHDKRWQNSWDKQPTFVNKRTLLPQRAQFWLWRATNTYRATDTTLGSRSLCCVESNLIKSNPVEYDRIETKWYFTNASFRRSTQPVRDWVELCFRFSFYLCCRLRKFGWFSTVYGGWSHTTLAPSHWKVWIGRLTISLLLVWTVFDSNLHSWCHLNKYYHCATTIFKPIINLTDFTMDFLGHTHIRTSKNRTGQISRR